jgi:hypothetical protein
MVADTRLHNVWVLDGQNVYEFGDRRAAFQFVVGEYRKQADMRSMQPGQNYNLTMADGSTKLVQVQNQTPDGVQVLDPNSGQSMMIPHVQPGAEPKPAQAAQPKMPNQGGTATPAPNQGVSPENVTSFALGRNDFKVMASEIGREPYNCKHDNGYLYRKDPSAPEKYCASCGMVYAASRTANIPVKPTAGKFYFCKRCNTSRTAIIDAAGTEVHKALPTGEVVRYLSCQHTSPIDDTPITPSWQPRQPQQPRGAMKTAVITGEPGSYHVKSEEGKNLGGPYKSREQAEHRLKQVEYFKHKGSIARTADYEEHDPDHDDDRCDPDQHHDPDGDGSCPYCRKKTAKILSDRKECVNCGGHGNLNDTGECPKCARRRAFRTWKNRERIVRAFDLIADAPFPGQQGMPSGDVANEGQTIQRDEKSAADFAEDPETQPPSQDPNAKRKLTPHEIVDEAESLIRNGLVKGVKMGVQELTEYMITYYNNAAQELIQGITLAWQKVQYEESAEGGNPTAPSGEGLGPQAPTTPEEAAQMAPKNGPIRTRSF